MPAKIFLIFNFFCETHFSVIFQAGGLVFAKKLKLVKVFVDNIGRQILRYVYMGPQAFKEILSTLIVIKQLL